MNSSESTGDRYLDKRPPASLASTANKKTQTKPTAEVIAEWKKRRDGCSFKDPRKDTDTAMALLRELMWDNDLIMTADSESVFHIHTARGEHVCMLEASGPAFCYAVINLAIELMEIKDE
ncbi:MAG: hypothetical protein JKY67_00405 [Pseudomonadales bacterium]|nr:hypothetical protein [Pseudomonadales bacterium]MBL4864820.1 hypothetical protein [Pseudomonadales bacterium]